MIYDRAPENQIEDGLQLTNLHSGATHDASNTILQNIWQTWVQDVHSKQDHGDFFDITRSVGIISDIDMDKLNMQSRAPIIVHVICLAGQFAAAVFLAIQSHNFEVLIVLSTALLAQTLLLLSIRPSANAWKRSPRGHRPAPVMLHKNLDSMGVLIIRHASTSSTTEISLEEYCWESQASSSNRDWLKLIGAGASFGLFVLQIILVGWMSSSTNRIIYLALGLAGLVANMFESVVPLNWRKASKAYEGLPNCAPDKGSLMSAVAMLVAGNFTASDQAARLLYPDNDRFTQSLKQLTAIFNEVLCDTCRSAVLSGLGQNQVLRCQKLNIDEPTECAVVLETRIKREESKQLSDGMASVGLYLSCLRGARKKIEVSTKEKSKTEVKPAWQ